MLLVYKETHIEVHDYDFDENSVLIKSLSVWNSVTFSYDFSAYFYDEDKKILYLPKSIKTGILTNAFPNIKTKYDYSESKDFKYNNNMSIKFGAKDDIQLKAISFLLEDNKQKFLSLPTGGGKTYCTINYVAKKKHTPITFVDRDSLINQWKESIKKFTNIKDDEIFIFKGKDSIEKLLKMSTKDVKKFKWFLAIHRTFSSYANNDKKKITELFKKLNITVKLFDEAHIEFKNIFLMDCLTPADSIYITATPFRSKMEEQKVFERMYHKVPTFKVDQNQTNLGNYLNIILVKYNSKPSDSDQLDTRTHYGFSSSKWSNITLSKEEKVEELINIVKSLFTNLSIDKSDNKVALILQTNKACSEFKSYLEEDDFFKKEVGLFNSSIKDINKRNKELEKPIIITTDRSFNGALDIPKLQFIIDFSQYGSKVVATQIFGRLRYINEENPVYYISITDVGYSSCKKQLSTKMSLYKEKAKKIFILDV